MRLWSKVLAIVWKDVLAELRTREMFSSMLVFALLVIVIFNFSFELRVENVALVAPGVLWVTFAFASTLELNRSMAMETENDCLDGLFLAPMDRGVIYFGKMLGNLIFISAIEAIMLPIFSVLFNLNLIQLPLLLTIFLGTIGFAAVGTLLAAMAVNTRAREVMLPVLLFPVILPVVIAAAKVTGGIIDGVPLAELAYWLRFLVAFDIIFLVVSYLTFDFVVQG
ncbi:MAG: ABC transporter permease [Anaerolineae bacterium]|nr:ABC transporter permease [Anaerolineae bacterium]NIN99340.1 ABC transporter permease [Anaerolineae bacterium]NIQ82205.1 ABC transporter permease [Anaerolineae bacterium]